MRRGWIFVEFANALEATRCALAIQQRLTARNSAVLPERRFQVRIGIHLGDVVRREGKVIGDAVNIAARIEPLAEAGGICLTRSVFDQVVNKLDTPLRPLGQPELKNIRLSVEVYRVVLPWTPPEQPSKQHRPTWRTVKRLVALASAAAVLVLVAVGISLFLDRERRTPIRSLAVLPLENLSGDASQEYFSDGITDALTANLGQISALRVISRTTMMRYKNAPTTIPELARKLNVDAVVEGSVLQAGGRIRITAQLIEGPTDRLLWANNYERDVTDVIALQNEVTLAIAREIKATLLPGERTRLAKARPVDPKVYELYQRGQFLEYSGSDANNQEAIKLFEQAVGLDPTFAPAWAALARTCVVRFYRLAPEQYAQLDAKAHAAVEEALRLDLDLGEAYVVRALLLWNPGKNFRHDEAIIELRRALELNPSSANALLLLNWIYSHTGFPVEALGAAQAAEAVNPLNPESYAGIAGSHLNKLDYDQAVLFYPKVGRVWLPSVIGSHWAWALFGLGQTNAALEKIEEFLKENPEDRPGELTAMKALLLAAQGDEPGANAKLREAIAKKQTIGFGEFHHTAYFIACAYARLRKNQEALQWLKDAADTGFPCYSLFAKDPNLDNLRHDAGFAAFLNEQEMQWRKRKEDWGRFDLVGDRAKK